MGYASDVVKVVLGEVGYRESRTNHQKYSPAVRSLEWSQDQPWCHTFISWGFQKAGMRDLAPVTASCLVGVAWFKSQNRFSSTPRVGDIVYYGPQGGTHVELVTEVTSTHIRTCGGNTSGSMDGVFYNGDGVYEKWVDRDNTRIYGYGRPAYEVKAVKPSAKPPKFVKELRYGSKGAAVTIWQNQMSKRGWNISVDGVFGVETQNIAEQFQLEKDLEKDGVVGKDTWNAAWTEPVT